MRPAAPWLLLARLSFCRHGASLRHAKRVLERSELTYAETIEGPLGSAPGGPDRTVGT